MQPEIPKPITFNPYKHHFGFLLSKIEKWKREKWKDTEAELLCMGDNLLDFYIGKLTVNEIIEESITYFRNKNSTDLYTFENWLKPAAYKKITLSDKSEWLIKKGMNNIRFIHIHPAKHSPYTIRVKAITLKTVIALQIYNCKIQEMHIRNIVNHIRKTYLKLSPVKTLSSEKGILKLWRLFEELKK